MKVMMSILTNNWWMALLAILTIFTPIYSILWLIIIISTLDMVTAIFRDFKKHKEVKGFWNKIGIVKSRKLRRTSTKIFFYLMIVMLIYAIPIVCFDATIFGLYLSKAAAFSISAHELFSIGENMNLVTGSNIFTKIIRKSIMRINEWVNQKIEDPS